MYKLIPNIFYVSINTFIINFGMVLSRNLVNTLFYSGYLSILIIPPALAQHRPVEVIGKTDEGDKIILLTSTIHRVGYGEATEFEYVLEDAKTSRVNHATTEACNHNGKVDLHPNLEEGTTGYQWFVLQQDGKKARILVTATSAVSKRLLDRVCYYGWSRP